MPRLSLPVLSTAALLTLFVWGAPAEARASSQTPPLLMPLSGAPRPLNPFTSALGRTPEMPRARPTLAQEAAPRPASPPPAAPSPLACGSDEQCPEGTICSDGACQTLDRPLHVLLFRKDGPRTAFWPFYFSRTGTPGYRVVAPFYWHFWSQEGKARVVAPFYWRFEDHAARKQSTALWLGPLITWSKQPDASSFGVWPLFYGSTKFGWAAPLLGSFAYAQPDEGRSLGLLAFLYYWSHDRKTQESSDVLFPLLWSFRGKENATTIGFPLLWSFRRSGTTNTLFIPLFFQMADRRNKLTAGPLGYASWAGPNLKGSHLWVYWYGRSKTKGNYDVLFPLLWSFRDPQSSATVLFPLAWHFSDPKGHTTVLGPYLETKGTQNHFRALFPLLFTNQNLENKSSWGLFLPLAYWSSQNAGNERLVLTPFGGYSRNRQAGTSALTLWLPPIITRRTPTENFQLVFPLFYRGENDVERTKTLWALLFYRQKDPRGSTTTLFPLVWHFHDAQHDATATAVLPFFFRRNAPDDKIIAIGAGALAYHRDRGALGSSAGLFPLAFFGRYRDERHAVVFPLLWHFSSPQRSSTLALPLFGHWRTPDETTTAIFPLLYFQGHTPRWAYRIQFPLFWQLNDRQTGSSTTVLGPGFYTRKATGWSAGLFPLLFAGRSNEGHHTVVAPLFWHFRNEREDRTRTLVGPYYRARQGGERTDALFPLLYYRRGARSDGANELSFTLFPLVHFARTATTRTFVTPLAMGHRTPLRHGGFVGPYFWYESPQKALSGLLPIWWDFTNKQTQQRTRLLGPWVAIDQPDMRARFLFPFWGGYRAKRGDVEERGTYVFPTYFHQRNSDGYALDTLFPLFWRSKGPHGRALQIGPFFSRATPTSATEALLPLYFYKRNPRGSWLLTPLGYRRNDFRTRETTTWMALLFYQNRTPERSRTVLFPLWFSGHEREKAHQVFFPLFWRVADDKQKTSTAFFGPFFARRNGSMKTWGLFPLAWYGRDTEKPAGTAAVLPLFYASWAPEQDRVFTPLFGRGRAKDSSWWYVPPVFRRTSRTSTTTGVFPLGFSHRNDATETTTRAILPLLHFSRSSPDRAISSWLGLFWHRRTIASSTNVLFPLFFDHHSFYQSRTSALLPLVLRYHQAAERTTYWFAPLFYKRTGPEDATTVLFPIYWNFKQPERQTQFLFPLFAHLERARWQGTYIFPNIWYRTGKGPDAGTSRLFIFPFWESEVKRPGDYLWEVLLGLFGYERAGRNRFVKVLFIPFELEPVPRTNQVSAWYGRAPRTKALPRGRGFAGHIW